eukprot:TRINITY_DN22181_c0_g1_i1.p1 TRINITY_DN22181_c0_g1~~TRINITY_DN22181_c0_g1_i1.p1  ORF type:complete len:294 (+),score=42.78 TRINITY_DN22181_c0_g1_i1:86-967(+)
MRGGGGGRSLESRSAQHSPRGSPCPSQSAPGGSPRTLPNGADAAEVCKRLWERGCKFQQKVARKNTRARAGIAQAERAAHGFAPGEDFFTPRINRTSRRMADRAGRQSAPLTPWRAGSPGVVQGHTASPREGPASEPHMSDVMKAVLAADQLVDRLLRSPSSSPARVASRSASPCARPEAFRISRAEDNELPDVFVPAWPGDQARVLQKLLARVERQQAVVERQAARIEALEYMVAYCGTCLRVDLEAVLRQQVERRREFRCVSPAWQCGIPRQLTRNPLDHAPTSGALPASD